MTKSCKNCKHCRQCYSKFWCGFLELSSYYCKSQDKMTYPSEICERYEKKTAEYDLSPSIFDEAENDINYLLNRLKDK